MPHVTDEERRARTARKPATSPPSRQELVAALARAAAESAGPDEVAGALERRLGRPVAGASLDLTH